VTLLRRRAVILHKGTTSPHTALRGDSPKETRRESRIALSVYSPINTKRGIPYFWPSNSARQKDSLYTGRKMAMIDVPIIAIKLSHYARRTILLGSLSYEPRGNLSEFNRLIIGEKSRYIKNILDSER